jgi:hypothetical protein
MTLGKGFIGRNGESRQGLGSLEINWIDYELDFDMLVSVKSKSHLLVAKILSSMNSGGNDKLSRDEISDHSEKRYESELLLDYDSEECLTSCSHNEPENIGPDCVIHFWSGLLQVVDAVFRGPTTQELKASRENEICQGLISTLSFLLRPLICSLDTISVSNLIMYL